MIKDTEAIRTDQEGVVREIFAKELNFSEWNDIFESDFNSNNMKLPVTMISRKSLKDCCHQTISYSSEDACRLR